MHKITRSATFSWTCFEEHGLSCTRKANFSSPALIVFIWVFTLCSNSYKNNTLKISTSQSAEFSSYIPVKFFFSLKSRYIFNLFYCFSCLQTNIHACFYFVTCAYSKNQKVINVKCSHTFWSRLVESLVIFRFCVIN